MLSRLFDPHCRYEGEEVAAVAAETQQQAWDAVRAIQVEYETLPFVTGMEEALKPGAPPVQEGGNQVGAPREIKRGDVAKGFAEADVVLEETYRTSCEIHAPLEAHGSVAQWDGDRLTVWDTNQGPFGIQSGIAQALNMPLSKVRVISSYMGGGFGSKQEAGKYTVIAALLAQKTARPVKTVPDPGRDLPVRGKPAGAHHEAEGRGEEGRHAHRAPVDRTGRSRSLSCRCQRGLSDRGLVQVPECAHRRDSGVYQCRPATGLFALRAIPQGNWALEQMMDALAEKIGMDPVELRLKNISTVCQTGKTSRTPPPACASA